MQTGQETYVKVVIFFRMLLCYSGLVGSSVILMFARRPARKHSEEEFPGKILWGNGHEWAKQDFHGKAAHLLKVSNK